MAKKSKPKRYKLPRELVVGDSIYTVRKRRQIEPPKVGKKETVGLCCPSDMEISIKTGQIREERISTWLHEVIHSWEQAYDLEMSHDLVYKLEVALFNFLKDNFPEILDAITV